MRLFYLFIVILHNDLFCCFVKLFIFSQRNLYLMLLFFTLLNLQKYQCLSSVQSVMSNSLWPHGLQHARLPCSSPFPRVCSNSCPWIQWCHPTMLFSVIPFSSHLQSFPVWGYFPVSKFFASGSQSIGASASMSVLPMNIQDWFSLGLTGLISLQLKDCQECSTKPQFKSINSLVLSFLYGPTLTSIHDYWKNHSFDCMDLCQ